MSILRWFILTLPYAAFAQAGLVNGDFESPGTEPAVVPGWTVIQGTFAVDANKHNQGNYSGKLDGGTGPALAIQDVPVQAGISYLLTGCWRNGDKTAGFDVARAAVIWLTAPGGLELGKPVQVHSGDTVGDWNSFQLGPLTAPTNATSARIRLMSTFGLAAFDNLRWGPTDGSAPSTQPHSNPGLAPGEGVAPTTGGPSSIEWHNSLPQAYQKATVERKRVLLFFAGADPNSAYFESTLFTDPSIVRLLRQTYIAIKLPHHTNAEMAGQLKVNAPGSIILYGPDGAALGAIREQLSVNAFESILRK